MAVMQNFLWLRIAAGLTAFQAVGHTFGAVLASPSSVEESALRETMRAFRVSLMGIERSYSPILVSAAITVCLVMAAMAHRESQLAKT